MNILDILMIISICILGYKIYEMHYKKKSSSDSKESFSVEFDDDFEDELKKNLTEDIYDTSMSYMNLINKTKTIENPYLSEVQFHTDYRDTLNAFNLLVPNQKQLFNRSDLPIINTSTPSNKEIKNLVKNFISETNKTLDRNVGDALLTRNWKDNYGEKDFESGWDKQMKKLGLPSSIYTKPAKKSHIKLIKIENKERLETEDEIRYVIVMIVQKHNVDDQMIVKVNFQIDKQDVNIERTFFENPNKDTIVKIEDVFVMGFMTKNSFGKQSIKNEYYDFGGITDGRMFSQKEIMKELNKKRKEYNNECML